MKKSKIFLAFMFVFGLWNMASGQTKTASDDLISQPGIIIMIILLVIPLLIGAFILILKLSKVADKMVTDQELDEETRFAKYLSNLEGEEIETVLETRKKARPSKKVLFQVSIC